MQTGECVVLVPFGIALPSPLTELMMGKASTRRRRNTSLLSQERNQNAKHLMVVKIMDNYENYS